jgi:hypothetical protein
MISNNFPSHPFQISKACSGQDHSWALIAGAIYEWGHHEARSLSIFDLVPKRVSRNDNFRVVASGERIACAIDYYGFAHLWNGVEFVGVDT